MNVTFLHIGLKFTAEADFEPLVPARISGAPESCYPAEGGSAEITALTVDGKDASFLLDSDLADDLSDAAYEACCESIEAQREEYEEGRAADRAFDREYR